VTPLSRADKLRIVFAPLYVLIGGRLVAQGWSGHAGIVLAVGLAFVAFGIYRLALIARALGERR
jgi:hypothetical protein